MLVFSHILLSTTSLVNKDVYIKTEKDEHWRSFCERCAQPIRSNALQKVVSDGHLKLYRYHGRS